ncbi:hypothetical protein CH306_25855 [Rhodococcus sp. 15-725-2-2b]|uniref:phytoene desaturase family protein n=1 Tax=unclassified Rhodococcus (in: high G+C Gram-positive bacteria) TaxID=192944 RepID=UPI000B9B6493|nr:MULTISPECIES: NAD(P)/FAD-dependent oxidoreductase [unclassified Rhodococcus (in: high G+C Gram-positive bacteria)]OZC63672.1 hypothetical protein CH277_22805 [Rhodococcus sp. 06-469-3-2]OZD40837.1 hypothetical protein CH264_24490 [Rhodococcus sp. 06-1477-1A]OZE67055.1 hypothetical protein CH306_25855 [Rhodococcus sp. 15-725-2-2b]
MRTVGRRTPHTRRGDRAVVIGAGHNGLTAACYLARAGMDVTVLEASPRIGGMTSSYAALPEFPEHLLSAASIDAVYWRASTVHSELDLDNHGLRFVEHDPAWAWLDESGRSLIFQRDVRKTIDDIARFSRRDAERYAEFVPAARRALDIQDLYGTGASNKVGASMLRAAFRGIRNSATRDLLGSALTRSGTEVIEALFESPEMRGAFAAMGNILGSITIDGSGIAALATAPLHKYGVGRAVGGMQAIPDALTRCLASHSGRVLVNSEVDCIVVNNRRVTGVRLSNQEFIAADVVVSSVAPQITGSLLRDADVDESAILRRAPANALNIGCFKVDMALGGMLSLPRHQRSDGIDMRKPTMMFGSFEQVIEAERHSREGRFPIDPPWWATILSATDPTQAPEGQDVLYLYAPSPVHPVTPWIAQREQAASVLVDAVAGVIDGIAEHELGRVVETPEDLETRLKAPNGCIYHVDQIVTRLGPMRPGLGWGSGDKQVKGLFLGGAGSHPSGGVSGIPGQIAARSVLADPR